MLHVNILWLHVLNSTYLCKYFIFKQIYTYLIIFSYSPHKCPDPNPRSSISKNLASRFSKNIHSRKLNQRLIHSHFCPTRQFSMDDGNAYFTCCEFLVSLLNEYNIFYYIIYIYCFNNKVINFRAEIVLLLGQPMVK